MISIHVGTHASEIWLVETLKSMSISDLFDINHLEDRLLSLHSARTVNSCATGTTNIPLLQNSRTYPSLVLTAPPSVASYYHSSPHDHACNPSKERE